MFNRTNSVFGLVLALSLTLVACQNGVNREERSRIGRNKRGVPANANTSGTVGTQWGSITGSGDSAFQQELYVFTAPMLTNVGPDDQLGYVSSQASGGTGVMFWGAARMLGAGTGNGQLDPNSARIHIEIYDDRAASGRSPVVVHIGPDQEGFLSAQGSMQNGQISLVFTDTSGSVIVQGALQGQYFAGQIGYTNTLTGGQARVLGQFQVPACGFFACNQGTPP